MIIFGTRTRVSTVERGQFICPRCGPGQKYERKHAKRWFTLYFIPVFPVGDLGQFIECGLCHGTFKVEVLSLRLPPVPDVGLESELKRAVLRALLLHLPAGEQPERDAQAQASYKKLTSMPLSDAELAKERQALSELDAAEYFTNFAKHLDARQRERILQSALEGASAAPLSQSKRDELASFGALLGMTDAHVRGVLGAVEAAAAS